MPFIERGIINLFPDPCYFDHHLREQMFNMAQQRLGPDIGQFSKDVRTKWAFEQEARRTMFAFSDEIQKSKILKAMPDLDAVRVDAVLSAINKKKENDPLAILQAGGIRDDPAPARVLDLR